MILPQAFKCWDYRNECTTVSGSSLNFEANKSRTRYGGHAHNSGIQEVEKGGSLEFEAS